MSAPPVKQLSIPSNENFTDALANHILLEQRSRLPDLTDVAIFLPNAQAVQQMRQSLHQNIHRSLYQQPSNETSLYKGHVLLGGFIGSLEQWLNQHPISSLNELKNNTIRKQINQSTRQLLLIEALKRHPNLFSAENHWQVCDSLLELFDEFSLSQHQWLNESTPSWISHLQQAYQANKEIAHLNQEADIVRTLWHAWQQQLEAMQIEDKPGALKQNLINTLAHNIGENTGNETDSETDTLKNTYFYIVGLDQLSPLERAWCEQLSRHSHVRHITQGQPPCNSNSGHERNNDGTNGHEPEDSDANEKENAPGNSELQLLENIYNQQKTFFERTRNYSHSRTPDKKALPDFLQKIKLYDAQSAEYEARAVDLKIRMSLLAGKTDIAVVTENRKLARRLRALLERAQVSIQDTAGWALATTSAAAILERWLECIEQNFAWQALIDLLKSPFFCEEASRAEHLKLVYRFEQDIILHENIAADLQRYKTAIQHRQQRLNAGSANNTASTAEQLLKLLTHVETAAHELIELFNNEQSRASDIWIDSFIRSIKNLGIYSLLSSDIAGLRVQQELEKLSTAHSITRPELNWLDFRTWLGNTLEREQFKPHNQNAAVKIMNLQQAQYCQFDTLIIAGANQQSLPGTSSQHTFFNQSVRQALGFKNWPEKKAYCFYQFRQMLLSADDILITWQAEENGEWMPASPWASSLQDFAQFAFKHSLKDERLDFLLKKTRPVTQHSTELLQRIEVTSQPFPCISEVRIPDEFSASRHQRLIDCPYKFFASDVLKLKALEEISLELMKSEYGEKVHLILQAFHQQCPELPAPFKAPLCNENKTQALAHIKNLSQQVFETQIEDSVEHRGWLNRWLDTAEAYINWQIQRQHDWKIHKLEKTAEQTLSSGIQITGRLDRVDTHNNRYSIIDYKTGNCAKQSEIDLAENVQLSSYASLMEDVCNVIYLKLDKGIVKQTGILEGEGLNQLKADVIERLETLVNEIKSSSALPAWGDALSCAYCDMGGLCRKQMWEVS